MFRKRKKYLWFIAIFFLIFYILPNLLNFRERRFFSDDRRLSIARETSHQHTDSVRLVPGEYYNRGKLYTWFFGMKNRELWTTGVGFKRFNYDTTKGGLVPYEMGGSQQTISIRLRDSAGKHWVLRSVNKDQKNVLPWWLRPSIIRPVFRDQASAMNPYGAKVVASLAASIGLPHTEPEIYWVPFVEKHEKYNERIAGRIVYLEQYIDSTWANTAAFLNANRILDTEEMEAKLEKEKTLIDTLLYLKTRLFDMLISDWDRHQDQWRWALTTDSSGKQMMSPIARDRDIAFYVFDEGVINQLALRANPKFQSFRKSFDSIEGLMQQSQRIDKKILKGVRNEYFLLAANEIKNKLQGPEVAAAFIQYPPEIYQRFGRQHEDILRSRLQQLTDVASRFHELVNKD